MRPSRILVLYKKSAFEYYQSMPPEMRPDCARDRRFRETHDRHYQSLEMIETLLRQRGLDYQTAARGETEDYNVFDFVITVGGDGTLLEGARYVEEQLILGVNSDPHWSVGRLCAATAETFSSQLDAILSDHFQPGFLNRMEADFERSGQQVYFINDVLIAHENPASMSRYSLTIDRESEEQRSSGVWISTAAGSTGAVHSAGAPVLNLESDKILYMPRELYQGWTHAPYRLLGGILDPETMVGLESLMNRGMVFVDGCHLRISFSAPERIKIRRAATPLRLAVLPES